MGDYLSMGAHEMQFIFEDFVGFQAILWDLSIFLGISCHFLRNICYFLVFYGISGLFFTMYTHQIIFIFDQISPISVIFEVFLDEEVYFWGIFINFPIFLGKMGK